MVAAAKRIALALAIAVALTGTGAKPLITAKEIAHAQA